MGDLDICGSFYPQSNKTDIMCVKINVTCSHKRNVSPVSNLKDTSVSDDKINFCSSSVMSLTLYNIIIRLCHKALESWTPL